MVTQRIELFPGVFFTALRTDKFKTDCLSLSLLTALDRDTVSANALLPRVLERGTRSHPTMEAVSAACDELYGARLLPLVRKAGEVLAVGFYFSFLSERFVPGGGGLMERVAGLLGELLLRPALSGGLLREDYVESEKEKLIDDIRGKVNDKRSYSASRLTELMFCYEAYGCDDMGTEASASEVDRKSLTEHYRNLLATSPVEIFYCGALEPQRVEAALREALAALPRGEIDWELGTDVRMNAVEAEPRYFDETMDVGQGKLCMGFRLGDSMQDPDFAALRVFNALYGGTVTSKLFLNVRKSSRCAITPPRAWTGSRARCLCSPALRRRITRWPGRRFWPSWRTWPGGSSPTPTSTPPARPWPGTCAPSPTVPGRWSTTI